LDAVKPKDDGFAKRPQAAMINKLTDVEKVTVAGNSKTPRSKALELKPAYKTGLTGCAPGQQPAKKILTYSR
jgi:hypothetical protein